MSGLFFHCSSLKSLPDISKWNTNNVTNMSGLFYNCSSLIYLPDISKFKTDNLIDILGIFADCCSLLKIPDISKWFINLKRISIEEIDEIINSLNGKKGDSKWIINYKESIQIDIREFFEQCGPLNENTDRLNWLIKFQKEFNRKISTIRIRCIFYKFN